VTGVAAPAAASAASVTACAAMITARRAAAAAAVAAADVLDRSAMIQSSVLAEMACVVCGEGEEVCECVLEARAFCLCVC